ncbi:lysylphosphatidylglycerol synthase transmembrane domain-containing protein [Thermococcus sp.]|uniref:lysylphosphatidylglycerol synthase transmembrane domain-containing protein n=1 Tax=Thermococcus sp. TaxID=35749 RepID=UPI00262100E9|nr:lysylphosphatidylglycerol synthase transmembrane domain-containing protein [Thermococcus sp.]
MKKRTFLSILALLFSVGYIAHTIEVEELGEAISTADPRFLLLAFGMAFSAILVSTLRWYIVLRKLQKTSFRKTFTAILSGFYMMAFLPPSVGHVAKVKLVGGDYFKALSALAFGISLEVLIIAGISLLVFGATKWGIFLLGVLFLILFYDRGAYTLLNRGIALIQRLSPKLAERLGNYLERTYSGWRSSRRDSTTFTLSLLLSVLAVLLQVAGIIAVGRAFGLPVGLLDAFKAFILSTLFASLSGIPSGIGANELGITLALGSSTKSTLVAFTYKFIYQYLWSLVGAVEFYRAVGGRS